MSDWRYIETELEYETLMNSGSTPVLGVDYIVDGAGDVLVHSSSAVTS